MSARGLCLTLLVWAAPAPAAAGEQALTELLRQETATLASLESLAGWLDQAAQGLEAASTRAAQLDYEQKEADRRSAALGQRLERRRAHLARRLRALYKLSRGGVVRLLLEATDAQDLSLRLSGASRVLDRDLQELRLYQRELGQLEGLQAELARTRRTQQASGQELAKRQQQFQQAQQKHRELLAQLRASRRAQQRAARELSHYQRTLLARITASEERLASSPGLLPLRGHLPAPVAGPVVGRFGGITDSSRLEILRTGLTYAPPGQRPVQAVAAGKVQLAGPLAGYGQLVLLEHGAGYFSLYGFLSHLAVAPGQEVRAGTPLGRSGSDPLSGRPALYFELRRGSQPLDPWPWLRH